MTQQFENTFPVISGNYDFESWCYTTYKKVRGRFVWKIDDFIHRSEMLTSSVFPTPAPNKSEWTLHLYPRGSNKSSSHHISLFICLESSEDTWAEVKLSLIDDEGRIAISRTIECRKFTHKIEYGFPKFEERDFILYKDNGILPNDELMVTCEIEIRLPSQNLLQEFDTVKHVRPLRLVKDMGDLLSSKSLSDVTIRVGEREFRAHKLILSARSPVFAAMFRNEMTETKNSAVDISDIDSDVFQEILEYIYTDKEISQTKMTKELLAAANKYELDGLKAMCEEALCETLSVENVLENLSLADIYNCSRLKDYAVRFVMKRRYDIIGSSDWNRFKGCHQSLVTEMFEKMCFL